MTLLTMMDGSLVKKGIKLKIYVGLMHLEVKNYIKFLNVKLDIREI